MLWERACKKSVLPLEFYVGGFYIFFIRQEILSICQMGQGTVTGAVVFGCECPGTQTAWQPTEQQGASEGASLGSQASCQNLTSTLAGWWERTQNYPIPCQRFWWNQQVLVKCFDSVKSELRQDGSYWQISDWLTISTSLQWCVLQFDPRSAWLYSLIQCKLNRN